MKCSCALVTDQLSNDAWFQGSVVEPEIEVLAAPAAEAVPEAQMTTE